MVIKILYTKIMKEKRNKIYEPVFPLKTLCTLHTWVNQYHLCGKLHTAKHQDDIRDFQKRQVPVP